MGYDSGSKKYTLKLINLKGQEMASQITVKGFGEKIQTQEITSSLGPGKNNIPEMPNVVKLVRSVVALDLNKDS